jgi:hypothetical protein
MQLSRKHIVFATGSLAGLFLILFGGAVATASDPCSPSFATFLQKDPSEGWVVSKISNSKGDLEEQLRLLLEELKQLEKDAEEKFRKEILPHLKREIEKLRNRLKEFSPGKEEAPQPQRVQA